MDNDYETLITVRSDMHRLAVRLISASELMSRGFPSEAVPDLKRAVTFVDDIGSVLDDLLRNAAVFYAPEEPAPAPAAVSVAGDVIAVNKLTAVPDLAPAEDPESDELAAHEQDPEPDDEPEEPAEVPTVDEELLWHVKRDARQRRFVRCPDFQCGKRVLLTDEETNDEIEHVIAMHRASGDHERVAVKAKR